MRVDCLRAGELDAALTRQWRNILARDATLGSPYFRPEFTLAVAAARSDVWVAVLEEAGAVVGFLPFHRGRWGLAQPIGLQFSDFHGFIALPEAHIDIEQVMRECGITCFEFSHALASQAGLGFSGGTSDMSPRIDLRQGYEAYAAQIRARGSKQLTAAEALARKVERELGPIRFTPHSASCGDLERLVQWKSATYSTFGPVLRQQWVRDLMGRLCEWSTVDFSGQLASVSAGDECIALHLGMRTASHAHYWLPAYSAAFSAYSPGILLLVRLIQAASSDGCQYVDLGRGMSLYKQRLMNGAVEVLEGRRELPGLTTRLRRAGRSTVHWARRSRLRPLLAAPGRRALAALRRRRFGGRDG